MSTQSTSVKPLAGNKKPVVTKSWKGNIREYGMLIALVVIMLFFQVLTDGVLLKPLNLTNLVLQNSYIIIMAIGMLLVIVAGHIDLSVGSVVGFVGALAAVLMVNFNWPMIPTVIVCLIAGGLIGAAQGYWVAYYRIPAFIVTLAGMLVFKGLTLALLNGQSVGPFPESFQRLSSGFIPDLFGEGGFHVTSFLIGILLIAFLFITGYRQRQKQIAHEIAVESLQVFLIKNGVLSLAAGYILYLLSTYQGLPNVLIIMALLISAYTFFTNKTIVGRRIYAIGGNEKAALLSGINTKRLTFLTFANMGVLAALAGMVFAARLNTATPKAGLAFELDVIAAVFIGGASMQGGVGKVIGAVVGALVMGVMNNGMSIMGLGIDWQQVIKGLVLLAAVIFDVYNKNKST
ncbi:multiple monosaccharide ABC transporter permease [Reinekea sp.]|jgi:putative multiple sugar transport system permease protein|uniref:multiple monosaccharide ABC transporter permease n=1 Tax=Reinekea sp. TaxID=1970455 RepID=UPI0039890DD9